VLKKIGQQLCPRKALLFLAPNVMHNMRSVKNIASIILLMFIVSSCSDVKRDAEKNEENKITEVTVDKSVPDTESIESAEKNFDTLIIKKKVYYLNKITKKDFAKIPTSMVIKTSTALKNVAFQDSTSISFSFANGSDTVFTHSYDEGWGNYAVYEVKKDYTEINYWLVYVGLYEGDAMFLLNKQSGKVTWIYSEPILSPNKKYFITHSADLEAGYNSNGIQLFKIAGVDIVELWTKDIDAWEPSEIKWENDSIIAIKQTYLDWENPNELYIDKYKTMKIINMHNIR
jgi:hypothetical protein